MTEISKFTDVWIQGNDPKRYSTEEVFKIVKVKIENPDTETNVIVGTDSHSYGLYYHFVTVICIWNVGKGGTYFYKSVLEPRKNFQGSQKIRLQDEVTKSLTVAFEMENVIGIKPKVHIDISPPSKKEFSSSFSDFLKGYVLSSGYDPILKPECFVSNCIADKHARKRTRRKGQRSYGS